MRKYCLFSIFSLLTVALVATAQEREVFGGTVEVMDIDGSLVTFNSIGIADDDDDVLVNAERNLFQKILYDGVENYNEDKPLVERNSDVLQSFFHAKYQKEVMGLKTGKKDVKNSLAYRAYVTKSQLEGQPKKNGQGKFEGAAIITVNHKGLCDFLKQNKVILDGDSIVEIKESPKPEKFSPIQRRRNNTQQ